MWDKKGALCGIEAKERMPDKKRRQQRQEPRFEWLTNQMLFMIHTTIREQRIGMNRVGRKRTLWGRCTINVVTNRPFGDVRGFHRFSSHMAIFRVRWRITGSLACRDWREN